MKYAEFIIGCIGFVVIIYLILCLDVLL